MRMFEFRPIFLQMLHFKSSNNNYYKMYALFSFLFNLFILISMWFNLQQFHYNSKMIFVQILFSSNVKTSLVFIYLFIFTLDVIQPGAFSSLHYEIFFYSVFFLNLFAKYKNVNFDLLIYLTACHSTWSIFIKI